MASPFPGRDSWLEDPRLWPDRHPEMISAIREEHNRGLCRKDHARIEDRVYLSDDDDPGRNAIIPDIKISRLTKRPLPRTKGRASAQVAEPIVAITRVEQEIREACISIADATDRSIVTIIENLSAPNRLPASRGRRDDQVKRQQVMMSETHRVEIDLLPGGERRKDGPSALASDSVVHGSGLDERPEVKLWLCPLEKPLPVVPVPLRGNGPDPEIDRRSLPGVASERADYDQLDNSREPPDRPLSRKAAGWAWRFISAGSRKRTTGS